MNLPYMKRSEFIKSSALASISIGLSAPLDAYDAAASSAVTPLSEQSITEDGQLVTFPDFTRGRWINRKPVFALDNTY
jgi:hypothetical protein